MRALWGRTAMPRSTRELLDVCHSCLRDLANDFTSDTLKIPVHEHESTIHHFFFFMNYIHLIYMRIIITVKLGFRSVQMFPDHTSTVQGKTV
jgi:hypothetical protein